MSIEAFPLQWPFGVKRTAYRENSRFDRQRPFGKVRDDLLNELRLLRAKDVILSTNVPLRRDGLPYSNEKAPADPGVAVYFVHPKRGQLCMACDRWRTVVENMRAVSETVAALRGIARWGTAEMMDAAFTGFQALPGPGESSIGSQSWWAILGVRSDADMSAIETRARALRAEFHPDKNPGDEGAHHRFVAVGEALAAARRERSAP